MQSMTILPGACVVPDVDALVTGGIIVEFEFEVLLLEMDEDVTVAVGAGAAVVMMGPNVGSMVGLDVGNMSIS